MLTIDPNLDGRANLVRLLIEANLISQDSDLKEVTNVVADTSEGANTIATIRYVDKSDRQEKTKKVTWNRVLPRKNGKVIVLSKTAQSIGSALSRLGIVVEDVGINLSEDNRLTINAKSNSLLYRESHNTVVEEASLSNMGEMPIEITPVTDSRDYLKAYYSSSNRQANESTPVPSVSGYDFNASYVAGKATQ